MASGTNYSQEYGQAEKAYLESDFARAAEIIDHLADEFPNDPNILLLRGHIYCYGFQNYDLAKHQYESVLDLSQEQDLLDFARSGIEQVEQLEQQSNHEFDGGDDSANLDSPELYGSEIDEAEDSFDIDFSEPEAIEEDFDSKDLQFGGDYEAGEMTELESDVSYGSIPLGDSGNPFAEDSAHEPALAESIDSNPGNPFTEFDPESAELEEFPSGIEEAADVRRSNLMVDNEEDLPDYSAEVAVEEGDYSNNFDHDSDLEIDTVLTEPFSMSDDESYNMEDVPEQEGLDYQDELEFDEIDSSFFDLEELEQGLPDTGLFNVVEEPSSASMNFSNELPAETSVAVEEVAVDEVNPPTTTTTTTFTTVKEEPQVEVKQGAFANFINAPIQKKQAIAAGLTGLASAIAVLIIGLVTANLPNPESEQTGVRGVRSSLLLALVAGLSSGGTAAAVGNITAKHIANTTQDLQNQFDDVYQGNLNAKATVYSQDEFGQLASGFNRMTRVILTTTQEAQRRAEETEQAKEDLQRQVIRLLDDVEGAARGDLTVQATVTADVLGAVADAFNLTIQSLREIVRQVKEAAEKVNKGSTDSELFARNQSSEALRMAEELAVTLNSVQMMTESIERVADNAREAEEVARSSSVTALKGGKAVERTVSGIFQIRETVSETARKVKRLAEASQEISKIVLLISQIAERTNQLALNATIQAAKAGEAGRGFAVVADEVRQLADRSGKSLKEIEQIVLQIQSETGSVMTAMEEGIQEVIDVTERAEQAKTALEDIIQVSNRIDTLVRSITADTVEQRENSRAVAQVMQSVELTAQATSQESQRVGGALQSLVGIARGLLSSVERFRIDKSEE